MLAAAPSASAARDEGRPVLVEKSGFDCLVKHVSRLRREAGEIVIVNIDRCPPRVESGFAAFPDFRPSATVLGAAKVLVLTRAQLDCIRLYRGRLNRLRHSIDSRHYILTLARCDR